MLKCVITFYLAIFFSSLYSQECFNYHQQNCKPLPSKFTYSVNSSSVSYKFGSGELRSIPFTLMEGKDYRFTICADNIFSDIINLTITATNGKVLYDNSALKYELHTEFSVQKTIDVYINIMSPKMEFAELPEHCCGCVGILIEEMVSVKLGF